MPRRSQQPDIADKSSDPWYPKKATLSVYGSGGVSWCETVVCWGPTKVLRRKFLRAFCGIPVRYFGTSAFTFMLRRAQKCSPVKFLSLPDKRAPRAAPNAVVHPDHGSSLRTGSAVAESEGVSRL
jgi:hypothetical protein